MKTAAAFLAISTLVSAQAPANAGRTAIVLLGGSTGTADWLTREGFAVLVAQPTTLDALQQSIRSMRARAKERNIRPDRIGVMDLTEGSDFAAQLAKVTAEPEDRPDFVITAVPLSYPELVRLKREIPAFIASGADWQSRFLTWVHAGDTSCCPFGAECLCH